MAHISPSDIIFATVSLRGAIVASLKLSGITTYQELIAHIRRALTTLRGMVTLDLRCLTGGWTQRSAILVS
jgi:hypothetical protein